MSVHRPLKPVAITTAILGAILLLMEIPIKLMEYGHLLEDFKLKHPEAYSTLISPGTTIVRWIVGLGLIGWLIYEYRTSRPESANQHSHFSSAAQPVPPITIAPVFNNSPNISPNISSAAPQIARVEQTSSVGPKLKFLNVRTINLDHGIDEYFFETHNQEGRRAIVASFRNEPSSTMRVRNVNNVRAQIIYRDSGGQEIGTGVARACWLDSKSDTVNFPVGESHTVILLVQWDHNKLAVPFRRLKAGWVYTITTDAYEFPVVVSTLEIIILNEDNDVLLEPVVVEVSVLEGDLRAKAQESATQIQVASRPEVTEQSVPRIELLEIRSVYLVVTRDKRYKFVENQQPGMSAIIAVFRNRHAGVGQQTASIDDVVARLIYTPKSARRLEINAGCWIDEVTQYVDFASGEVKKLIVAVDRKDGGSPSALHNPRKLLPIYYSSFSAQKERVQHIESHHLSGMPCNVEITLISEDRTLYTGTFELLHGEAGVMELREKINLQR